MKKLYTSLILILFCLVTRAQDPVTPTQAVEMNLKASGEYYGWNAGNNKIKGSPYLTEEFQPGMLHWNGEWTEGIAIRYNIYQGRFEAELESGTIAIDPFQNNIDTLKYNEEVFVKKYLSEDNKLLLVYLSLLGQQNDFALYKQYRIKLTEAVTDTDLYNKAKPAEYKMEDPAYYVFRDNEHWNVKGSKSLAELFQVDAKVVKNYLKDNNYKLSREEDLRETFLYFSRPALR